MTFENVAAITKRQIRHYLAVVFVYVSVHKVHIAHALEQMMEGMLDVECRMLNIVRNMLLLPK